jgi:hypothetical protein
MAKGHRIHNDNARAGKTLAFELDFNEFNRRAILHATRARSANYLALFEMLLTKSSAFERSGAS